MESTETCKRYDSITAWEYPYFGIVWINNFFNSNFSLIALWLYKTVVYYGNLTNKQFTYIHVCKVCNTVIVLQYDLEEMYQNF